MLTAWSPAVAADRGDFERSLEIDKKDCEVLSHISYGYVALAGLAKLDKDDETARERMIDAETSANRALGYCPESVLAATRKNYVESQWNALELKKGR